MKSIEQLLELSKNPYYKFTKPEQEKLDDFLAKQQDEDSASSQKKSSKKSDDKTPVVVRNVVKKTPTYPPEAPESFSQEF